MFQGIRIRSFVSGVVLSLGLLFLFPFMCIHLQLVCSMGAPFPSAFNIFVLFTYTRLNQYN